MDANKIIFIANNIVTNSAKGDVTMKKTAAILIAVVLVAVIFAACNGSDGGKVSDTSQDLGGAMTEMATDFSEMLSDDMMTDSSMQTTDTTTA